MSGIREDQLQIILRQVRTRANMNDLEQLSKAMRDRHQAIRSYRALSTANRVEVGLQVQLSAYLRPKYLANRIGEVVEIKGSKMLVKLPAPVGKFHTGQVWVPMSGATVL